jgi:Skp family chaperone for outer membrane proteins
MNKLQRLLFGEVSDCAKAQGYDVVSRALYATPAIDITTAVLNVLGRNLPPGRARPRRPPPAKP